MALGAAVTVAALAVPAAHAQDSSALGAAAQAALNRGVRYYQGLQYDSAIVYLRRSLAGTGGDTLSDSGRVRALSYMAAAQLFRGRRDSAYAVFRRLVVANPRARP